MRRRIAVGGILALVFGLAAVPARAQTTVTGGVVVQSGPGTGHVEVGAPPPPVREVIVVNHAYVPHGHPHGWWKKHGYRAVTVYYDGTYYYGRRIDRPGLLAVVVYERKGRYFREAEDDEGNHGHHDHDDGDD
jgi:hypothetical protein